MKNKLIFLDTETGGLDDSVRPLLEVGWAVEDEPVQSLRLPHDVRQCDPAALDLNGYFERELWDPRRWAPAWQVTALWEMLQDATLVCSNPSFDERFLLAYARQNGVEVWGRGGKGMHNDPWHHRKIDISAYAMPILGYDRPPGLATVIADLAKMGHTIEAPDHSAEGDVVVLRQAYRALQALAVNLSTPPRYVTGAAL